MIPHRSTALFSLVVFVALLLFVYSPSAIPDPEEEDASEPTKNGALPNLPSLNNFHLPSLRAPAHEPPPEQKDSTSGESKWFSNWEWLNPFSSAVTLDEKRAVLPPLRERRPIYTYYNPKFNPKKHKGNDLKLGQDADQQLLLAWRRAWFAQGFRPVVLTPGDAMKNPHFETVQKIRLSSDMENEVMRWLAWGHMGTGILADFHCFPMARYDDDQLISLRRGTTSELITRVENFKGAFYAAEKAQIDEALNAAVPKLNEKFTVLADLISPELFQAQKFPALALYRTSSLTTHYPIVAEKINKSPSTGRLALVQLINAHLHNTFQNAFPAGLAVLKPLPQHTTALVEPALRLAKALIQCPESPMPNSCPPNLPDCRACGASKQTMRISQPDNYKNTTFLFTIGTIPHPYTLVSLQMNTEQITTRQIRRDTARDPFLTGITKDHLGPDLGSSSRGVVFKQMVASDEAVGSSLWMTVESLPSEAGQSLPSELLDEFEWQFGFKIPRGGKIDPKTENDKESVQHRNPSQQGVRQEYDLITKAREIIRSKGTNRINVKDVTEAWNLADTEAWRFVKAYRARSVVERRKWEEAERTFAGSRH
ncbi:hypothetical protein NUU61_003933 [Penicillium alfredii]|uniref:Uncharacterized protein n=1 Tax=Penicillium alfredii TaxID=1506179 RepID=A0A9W9FK72_9EURO|nr:uncharacterized protein NUU61_003933 [Penicillium alfredii]KAJ5101711.1 hypothetical protein NUU61_003933 [Penicillium alfredii]